MSDFGDPDKQQPPLICNNCGLEGHLPSACPKTVCRVCGRAGHWGNECPSGRYKNRHAGTYEASAASMSANEVAELARLDAPMSERTGRRIAVALEAISKTLTK
jgi:hypothetical protein